MEGTDPKVIGNRILECRKKLKYSREKLAEAADVSNSFLAEVEHGTKNFSVPVLARLCKALGVSADYLLFGRENAPDTSGILQILYDRFPVSYGYHSCTPNVLITAQLAVEFLI